MREYEVENLRYRDSVDVSEIDAIKKWFRTEYIDRLNRANRYKYLGLPMLESRYALEMEAYEKENRLRELEGKEPLPEPQFRNII